MRSATSIAGCASTVTSTFTSRPEFGDHAGMPWISFRAIARSTSIRYTRHGGPVAELSDVQKRSVFEAHFRHEQAHVVRPAIANAIAPRDWPLVRAVALRPLIRFAYFPRGRSFWFRDFSQQEERIERGLAAFEFARQAGWPRVENDLADYRILPDEFFAEPRRHFAALRAAIMGEGSVPIVA